MPLASDKSQPESHRTVSSDVSQLARSRRATACAAMRAEGAAASSTVHDDVTEELSNAFQKGIGGLPWLVTAWTRVAEVNDPSATRVGEG